MVPPPVKSPTKRGKLVEVLRIPFVSVQLCALNPATASVTPAVLVLLIFNEGIDPG